ncbi:MAG: hypothetical protein QGF67_08750 [Lentisphaeria bacterium]|jgi:hypothetical protein|nr:hypothetical protein [Lentisphaeria bacterium]
MAVYLSDMSKCLPQSALSRTPQSKHWRLVEYESATVSGTMMVAASLSDTPDVEYPLEVTGWHAVYIGYATQMHGEHSAFKARLKHDPCFVTIADDEPDGLEVMTMRETFWRYADLTGESIIIGQHTTQVGLPATGGGRHWGGVAFVKLEPLSESQVAAIQADRADPGRRNIIASNDGGFVGWRNATTESDILEQVELYRDSDVGRIDWSVVSGEITKYPSKIGDNLHERNTDEAASVYAKALVDNLRTLIDKDLVPHKVAMKHAHGMGMKFYYMFRMALGPSSGNLFTDRPELCMLDRDGTRLPKMSFAFPEVRQCVLDLMEEVIDDEVDGINICWIRGLRVIGYEQPVIDAFEKEYGEDIRSVPEDDERICQIQAGFMTDFMRQVRHVADAAGEKRGRPLAICAMVGSTLAGALRDACDIKTWVDEKLVDEMISAAVLTRYLQANGVKEIIYAGPNGRDEYLRSTIILAETGADGLFIWDVNHVHDLAAHWAMIRRMGHTEEIIDGRDEKLNVKRIPLKTLDGIDVCHTQPWGGHDALVIYTGG